MSEPVALDGRVLIDDAGAGRRPPRAAPPQVGLGQPADLGEELVLDLAGRPRPRSRRDGRRPPTGRPGGPAGHRAASRAGGRGSPRGSSTAATSSSAKNALPSERRAIESTSAGARRRAGDRRSAARRARHARTAPGRPARRAAGARPRPATPSAGGGGAARRSGRSPTISSRSSRALRDRKASRSRVERSAQCRSSMTSRTASSRRAGRAAAGRPRRSGSGAIPSGPVGGRRVDRRRRQLGDQSGELGQARSGGLGDHVRDRPGGRATRRASTIGPNGSPSSPRATAPPSRTSQSSSRSRVDGLRDEAALADASLAADEDERGAAGGSRIGRREERRQAPQSGRRRPGWTGAEPCRR